MWAKLSKQLPAKSIHGMYCVPLLHLSSFQILISLNFQPPLSIHVNSVALSGCHPDFRQFTYKKCNLRYHPHSLEVTRLKTTLYGRDHKSLLTWEAY